jgi:hypothetical protein
MNRAINPGLVIGLLLLIFTASVCVYFNATNKLGVEETAEEQRTPLPAGPRRFP